MTDAPSIIDYPSFHERRIEELTRLYESIFPSQSNGKIAGRPCIVNGVKYPSVSTAALATGISRNQLDSKLRGRYKASKIEFSARYA